MKCIRRIYVAFLLAGLNLVGLIWWNASIYLRNHRIASAVSSRNFVSKASLLRNNSAAAIASRKSVAGQMKLHSPMAHERYLLNCGGHACQGNVFLLVFVLSAVPHLSRRMLIRETWGDTSQFASGVRVVFVMGTATGSHNTVAYENSLYGDIVQKDFKDTYHNLTHKTVAGLSWVSTYCTKATFVLKSDDDIFVNMFALLKHLQARVGAKRLLLCRTKINPNVDRSGKYKATRNDYAGKHFPTCCSGAAYVMSSDVVVDLHRLSFVVPFFWLEDVYVTGLLVAAAGDIKHTQFASTYVMDGQRLAHEFNGPQWSSFVFCHTYSNSKAFRYVWRRLVNLASGKSVAKISYFKSSKLARKV